MTRAVFTVAVLALLLGGWLSWEPVVPPDVGVGSQAAPPKARGCSARVERDLAGSLGVATAEGQSVPVLVVGAPADTVEPLEGVVALTDLIPGGLAGILLDPDTPDTAGVVTQTGIGVAAVTCTPPGLGRLVAVGASTRNEEDLELRLINPYAVDAVVEIGTVSENGLDTASELASVIVPARTVVTRDLDNLLPLRDSLDVEVTVVSGAVHVELVQTGAGDTMIIEGVAPAEELWLAVPALDVPAVAEVFNPNPAPTEVTVESVGGDVVFSETLPATSLVQVDVTGLGGVRVAAAGPIGAGLISEADGIRAGAPGVGAAARWLLPGVETVWVLNPSDVAVSVVVDGGPGVEIGPGELAALTGTFVDATGDVVAYGTVGDGRGLVAGWSLPDAADR